MRVLQASPQNVDAVLSQARTLGCEAIAWNLTEPCEQAALATRAAGLEPRGWWQAARDPEAAKLHPKWQHAPQHHEWLRKFESPPLHPALVGGWIGLNTKLAFEHAQNRFISALEQNSWCKTLYLSEIQGPPMGCGCGNPSCRSWDNAPGEKVAQAAYAKPEVLFPLEFFRAVRARTTVNLIPILCAECERGVCVGGVDDPDGPEGTDLCQGVPCVRPCALDFWPRLLEAFRAETPSVGLLLLRAALEKPEDWPRRAHGHYGTDLLPCIEPESAGEFPEGLIVTDAPQGYWPEPLPAGYVPAVPAIQCGYCPDQ
jgi:hypothetical protein